MWLLCETTYVLQATFKTRVCSSSLYKLADGRDTEEITPPSQQNALLAYMKTLVQSPDPT